MAIEDDPKLRERIGAYMAAKADELFWEIIRPRSDSERRLEAEMDRHGFRWSPFSREWVQK